MGTAERAIVLVVTAVLLGVNGLAAAGWLGGVTPGDVARWFDVPFTPSGFVFGIWGLVYAGLAAFSLYQMSAAANVSGRVARLRAPYVFSAVANMVWLGFWHHGAPGASCVVMLLLLAVLLAIHRQLDEAPSASPLETWCVDVPFRLYRSWIVVATLANLVVVGVHGAGGDAARAALPVSLAALAVAAGIAVGAFFRWRDPVQLGVIAWAAVGIAVRPDQPLGLSIPAMLLAGVAGLGAIGILLEDAPPEPTQSTTR